MDAMGCCSTDSYTRNEPAIVPQAAIFLKHILYILPDRHSRGLCLVRELLNGLLFENLDALDTKQFFCQRPTKEGVGVPSGTERFFRLIAIACKRFPDSTTFRPAKADADDSGGRPRKRIRLRGVLWHCVPDTMPLPCASAMRAAGAGHANLMIHGSDTRDGG
jgi:hypothetical protein